MASDYYASLGKNLIGTKTFDNLMAAFAGESQARNKYTYFASKAKKDGYEQIAKLFLQTADNEKEHAKIWYKILEGVHSTADNLEIAADGEHEEWTEMYPTFAKEAREEGFQEIANLLGLKADTPEEGVESLAKAVIDLCKECGLDPNFESMGIDKKELEEHLEDIAVAAYEDQCSPANPRVPMVEDMKKILLDCYSGN